MATLLWYILGLMTGLALLPIFSLVGRRVRPLSAAGHERKVYEDQLLALEAEAERGLIDKQELEAARTEVSRRLLTASDQRDKAAPPLPAASWALIAFGSAGLVVLIALGGYLALGRPDLVARAPAPASAPAAQDAGVPGQAEMAARLADVEALLKTNPDNGTGWEEAAALNFALGRYKESTRAYASAVRILGETAQRLGDYGEAMTQANGSVVSDEAKEIFERAKKLDPKLVQARFYLALEREQKGAFQEAADAWDALLKDAPAEAFWKPLVERRLAAVKSRIDGGAAAPAAPPSAPPAAAPSTPPAAAPSAPPGASSSAGPSAEDMRKAQEMSPDKRNDMVENMVTRLAARLEEDGNDIDGWVMLMRSYMVLNRRDDAKGAADSARKQFAGDEAALKRIEEAEKALGF